MQYEWIIGYYWLFLLFNFMNMSVSFGQAVIWPSLPNQATRKKQIVTAWLACTICRRLFSKEFCPVSQVKVILFLGSCHHAASIMSTADFGSPVTSYITLTSCNKANQDDRAMGGIPETQAAVMNMDVLCMRKIMNIHSHKQREPRLRWPIWGYQYTLCFIVIYFLQTMPTSNLVTRFLGLHKCK